MYNTTPPEEELAILKSDLDNVFHDIRTLSNIASLEDATYYDIMRINTELKSVAHRTHDAEPCVVSGLEEAKQEATKLTTKILLSLDVKYRKFKSVFSKRFEEFETVAKKYEKAFRSKQDILDKIDLDKKDLTTEALLKHESMLILGMLGIFDGKNIYEDLKTILEDYTKFSILTKLSDSFNTMGTDKAQKQIYETEGVKNFLKTLEDKKGIICKTVHNKRLVVGFIGKKCYVAEKCKVFGTSAKSIPYKYSINHYEVNPKDEFNMHKELTLPSSNELKELISKTLELMSKRDDLEKRMNNTIQTSNSETQKVIEAGSWENLGIYATYVESMYIQLKMSIELPKIVLALIDISLNNKEK
jgi:hypothetical protein